MDVYHTIIRPLVTEKSSYQAKQAAGGGGGTYSFEVHHKANKAEIKDAVEKIYRVKVLEVRTSNRPGKLRRYRWKFGRTRQIKKAIVRVDRDSHIDLFQRSEDEGILMGIKVYKRTSPGRRNASVSDYSEITFRHENRPVKGLVQRLKKTGGRNHHGVITCRHHGGGNKRMYRIIDFKRRLDNVPGKVLEIQYDPNRTCHIALVQYESGEKRYILAPLGLKAGDVVESGTRVEPKVGNCMPLSSIPLGINIHNIEMSAGQGGKLVRSAGGVARLMAREGNWATIELPSGEMRQVRVDCRATIGQIGNLDHQNVRLGKAGKSRYLGIRPTVRGKAMNPVAHPLGGGEGRSNGGRHPCSPWGKLAKGGRTRNPRARSNRRILRRRITKSYGEAKLRRKW